MRNFGDQWEVVQAYADHAGKPGAHLLRARRGQYLDVNRYDSREIQSYGTTLARIMPAKDKYPRGWWLVNGDLMSGRGGFSGSAMASHQDLVRNTLRATGMRMLIIPFSALHSAGIRLDSVWPWEIREDTTVMEDHSVARREDAPEWHDVQLRADGRWHWTESRHVLGGSLIRASYTAWRGQRSFTRRAWFLSGFDTQEPGQSYFLAQLPPDFHGRTIDEAFTALRPVTVRKADASGMDVVRQGDIFAIPEPAMTTRELPGPSQRMGYLLGTSHCATEVRRRGDETWARGILWHKPVSQFGWGRVTRRPEHVRRPLGDGRTWHLIQQNTVPKDNAGETRSWQLSGRVD